MLTFVKFLLLFSLDAIYRKIEFLHNANALNQLFFYCNTESDLSSTLLSHAAINCCWFRINLKIEFETSPSDSYSLSVQA